jgi:hypothetical protein
VRPGVAEVGTIDGFVDADGRIAIVACVYELHAHFIRTVERKRQKPVHTGAFDNTVQYQLRLDAAVIFKTGRINQADAIAFAGIRQYKLRISGAFPIATFKAGNSLAVAYRCIAPCAAVINAKA